MALPAPTAFPQPLAFPAPTPDDLYGALPDELRTMNLAGISQGAPTLTAPAEQSTAGQGDWILQQFSSLTGNAVGATNDPREWTLDEAAMQTNTALTKIATVNPDLAAQLQAQRTGEPDTGGGFWDGLKGAVASVAGLPGISQVLDWMSRPAQIIPELIGDREGDSWWEDVGQALSGNSEANWHRVLKDKFGIDGWLGAGLGFLGDIATDPLTYVGGGLLSLGRETAVRGVGKIAFGASDELGTVASRLAAESGNAVDTVMNDLWKGAASVASKDAAGGVAGYALRESDRALILRQYDVADKSMQYFAKGGRFDRMGPEVASELGLDPAIIDNALTAQRRAGAGFTSKEAYNLSRAAAAAQGGIRFKFSLPIFNLRYVSPAIPGSRVLADNSFQVARRFFSGQSGTARAMKLVERNVEGADEVFRTMMRPDGGFAAAKRLGSPASQQLSRGSFGLGGFLYSASEAVGRTTAHFSPNASLLRGGGLGSMIARDAKLAGNELESGFVNDAWALKDEDGIFGDTVKGYSPEDIQRRVSEVLKDPARRPLYAKYWADGTAEGLTPDEIKHLDLLIQIKTSADDLGTINGVRGLDEALDFDSVDAIHPSQAGAYGRGAAHPEVQNVEEWHVVGEEAAEDAPFVGTRAIRTHAETSSRGVVLRPGPGRSRAAVRAQNSLVVDLRKEGNVAPVVNPHDTYVSSARNGYEALAPKSPVYAEAAVKDEKIGQLVTQQAKADGYDSIVYIDEAGEKTLVMLDPAAVKRVSADAKPLTGQRRMPYVLTDGVKDSIRGVAGADELAYSGGLHIFEAKLEKEIAGLSLGEAEAHVRKMLRDRGVPVPEEMKVFEDDVVRIVDKHVRRTASQAKHALLGRTQRRLEHMGFGGAYDLGGSTAPTYRFSVPDAALDRLDARVGATRAKIDAAEASADVTKKKLNETKRISQIVARAEARQQEIIKDIEEGLQHADPTGPDARIIDFDGVGDIPAEAGYSHTVVPAHELEQIAEEGLSPRPPRDTGYWSDGAADERIWWSDDPSKLGGLSGRDVVVRRRRPQDMDQASLFGDQPEGDFFTGSRNDVIDMQYLGSDGRWHPMYARSRAPRPEIRPENDPFDIKDLGVSVGGRTSAGSFTITNRLHGGYAVVKRLEDGALAGFYKIDYTNVPEAARGKGLGRELYERMGDEALRRGGRLVSDSAMTDDARRVWQSLEKRGLARRTSRRASKTGPRGEVGEFEYVGGHTRYSPELASARKEASRLSKRQQGILSNARRLERRMETESRHIKTAVEEYDKVIAKTKQQVADVQVAFDTTPGNRAGFAQTRVPGFEGHYMPAYMAVEFEQAARGFRHLSDFRKEWRRFTGLWKTWATWLFPGFHLRNNQGAWFNNFLGGVGFNDYVHSFRMRRAAREAATSSPSEYRFAKKAVDPKDLRRWGLESWARGRDEPVTYLDLAHHAEDHGINATNGRAFMEASSSVDDLNEVASKRRIIERGPGTEKGLHPGRRYVQASRWAGEVTENVHRNAAWLRGMATTGGDGMGARAFTMMRHGDYTDLTDWESGFVRDLLPFYKWMRTNTPYQIHMLFENPGKLQAVNHLREAGYNAVGIDEEDAMRDMPPWMRDQFSIPLPWSKKGNMDLLTLDLPMSDLYKSGREYLSSFLPLVRPFAESYVFEQSTFTGAPITDKPKVTFDMPVVSDLLDIVGIGERNKEGALTLSEKTTNVMSVIPVFSRFRDWIFSDPDRTQLKANTFASAVFGVGLRPIDKESMTSNELGFYYQNILPEIERLGALGYNLPSKDDLQEAGLIAQDLEDMAIPTIPSTRLDQMGG